MRSLFYSVGKGEKDDPAHDSPQLQARCQHTARHASRVSWSEEVRRRRTLPSPTLRQLSHPRTSEAVSLTGPLQVLLSLSHTHAHARTPRRRREELNPTPDARGLSPPHALPCCVRHYLATRNHTPLPSCSDCPQGCTCGLRECPGQQRSQALPRPMLDLARGSTEAVRWPRGCMNSMCSYGADPACGPWDRTRVGWPPIA